MKKLSAALLVLLLLAVCIFTAACSSEAIINTVNWKGDESLSFSIRLVSGDAINMSSATTDYTGDFLLGEGFDQIKPLRAEGTYVTRVETTTDAGVFRVVTELNLVEYYNRADLDDALISDLTVMELLVAAESGVVGIKTIIKAHVLYNHTNLVPVSAERYVRGAYVGKTAQQANNYNLKTTYTKAKKNYACTVEFADYIDNGRSFIDKYNSPGLLSFFDNEMLLYVARSFKLSQITTSPGGSVAVLDPLTTRTFNSVGFTSFLGAKTEIAAGKSAVDVNLIAVSAASGAPIMLMFVSPTEKVYVNETERLSNKVLKFQQGYLVFTLNDNI